MTLIEHRTSLIEQRGKMFVNFFIKRPIFATVIALVIVISGVVCIPILPVAQFPDIAPPTVQVSATYKEQVPKL